MTLAFCNSCGHSELYGQPSATRANRGGRPVPKPAHCAKCGAAMAYGCPACSAERRSMDDKHCTKCGKAYK